MLKSTVVLCLGMLGLVVLMVYEVENQVDGLRKQLKDMNTKVSENREETHVLKAEWSYLNRPERLKKLTRKYFQMQQISVSQIKKIHEIPFNQSYKAHFVNEKIKPSLKNITAASNR